MDDCAVFSRLTSNVSALQLKVLGWMMAPAKLIHEGIQQGQKEHFALPFDAVASLEHRQQIIIAVHNSKDVGRIEGENGWAQWASNRA